MGGTELTTWQGANICFWLITIMVVASAAFATFSKSIVRAAFSLFFTLFGMAGYYVLLGSDFIAVTQVIIYVGGILVLLMFGVLLTNRAAPEQSATPFQLKLLYGLPVLLLLAVLFRVGFSGQFHSHLAARLGEPTSTVRDLGAYLLGSYVVPFVAVGVTLLLCLFGAAFLVRRRDD